MIKIEHVVKDGQIYFKGKGHAGFAAPGQDIVCAGVSAIVGTLGLYAAETGQQSNAGEGSMYVAMRDNKGNRAVIKAIMMGLAELARQYPDHITIK